MSEPKKSAAKSGDRRQPRLQDIERLETQVNQLLGEVEALRSEASDLRTAVASSPFAGIGLEEVAAFFAMTAHAANPASLGSFSDWKVKGRTKTLIRGFNAALSGNDDELIDGPRKRKKTEPGAKTVTAEPIVREHGEPITATGPKQSTAEALGLTPPRP